MGNFSVDPGLSQRLERHDEGLIVVSLDGGPEEMGRQHGLILARELRTLQQGFRAYLWQVKGRLRAPVAYLLSLLMAGRLHYFISPDQRREMRALAQAARMGYGFVLLVNVLDDLVKLMSKGGLGCSAFAVHGGRTRDGRMLVGRNLDYGLFLDLLPPLTTVFRCAPTGKRAFLSVGWPGYIGAASGMNEAGVVVSILSSSTPDRAWQGMPEAVLCRAVLETAGSAEEAVELLSRGPRRTCGNNFLVADEAEAMVVEVSARAAEVRRMQDDTITVTNHYQTPAMQARQGPFFRRPAGSELPEEFFTEAYSRARDERLRTGCLAGPLDAKQARELLRDSGIASAATVQSMLFRPASRNLWVARATATPVCKGEFVEIRGGGQSWR